MKTELELIALAHEAAKNAYAPYSNYHVGAALECADGEVFLGCNVENSSYGATICAERTALVSAIAAGRRDFTRIAIVADWEGEALPCGICRQVMFEFAPELRVIVASSDGSWKEYTKDELLPNSFGL